jgi:hypothetical protein
MNMLMHPGAILCHSEISHLWGNTHNALSAIHVLTQGLQNVRNGVTQAPFVLWSSLKVVTVRIPRYSDHRPSQPPSQNQPTKKGYTSLRPGGVQITYLADTSLRPGAIDR